MGVDPDSINVGGDNGYRWVGRNEGECSVRGGEKVTEDPQCSVPVGMGRVNGFAANETHGNADVGAGDRDPQKRASERQVAVVGREESAGAIGDSAWGDWRGRRVGTQLTIFGRKVLHKLVLVDADAAGFACEDQANHVRRDTQVGDGVGCTEAGSKPL